MGVGRYVILWQLAPVCDADRESASVGGNQ